MQIIPTLLNRSMDEFQEQLQFFSSYFDRFQIDIADGIFVPNKTIQIENLSDVLSPFRHRNLSFDFHLMVKDCRGELKKLKKLKKTINIKNVFFHLSACPDYGELAAVNPSFSIGLVLDASDEVGSLAQKHNLKTIPFVQIMSVVPGFQGSPFIPQTLNKFRQLRDLGYRSETFLDGGVSDKTLPHILAKKIRPDFLCVGSYLTKEKDKTIIGKKIRKLYYN